jgi:SAM-dependent methyltransferase
MDPETLAAYNAQAARIAAGHRAITPARTQALAQTFFHVGGATADVGCGSGRDSAWLAAAGYPVVGYDASAGMLAEAHAAYPDLTFTQAALPDLAGVPDGAYANALCNAVLMHLPRESLIGATLALARILAEGGRLILTYRPSTVATDREADGRLFTAIPPGEMALLLESAGLSVLHREERADETREGVTWHTLVAERRPADTARGLERIQGVLAQDRKVATYKLALIRALCAVARTQTHLARWGDGRVLVPLWPLAVQWLTFYWPLLTEPTFIAQIRGETPGSAKPIAFRSAVSDLAARHGAAGLYDVLAQIDADPARFRPALRAIAGAIRDGPVTHAGTASRVFAHVAAPRGRGVGHIEGFGWVAVPEPVWIDLSRFEHWIEDSVVVRWARLSAEMNPGLTMGYILTLLLQGPTAERDTAEARGLLAGAPRECVWSGTALRGGYHVDHAIPYAVWGNNDLWNLLPSAPAANSAKGAALPTRELLLRRRDAIVGYWRVYAGAAPTRFAAQAGRALGCDVARPGWETRAFAGLQEAVERLAASRGLPRWAP